MSSKAALCIVLGVIMLIIAPAQCDTLEISLPQLIGEYGNGSATWRDSLFDFGATFSQVDSLSMHITGTFYQGAIVPDPPPPFDDDFLSLFLTNWHATGTPYDLTGDDYVDDDDLSIVLTYWHTGTPPGGIGNLSVIESSESPAAIGFFAYIPDVGVTSFSCDGDFDEESYWAHLSDGDKAELADGSGRIIMEINFIISVDSGTEGTVSSAWGTITGAWLTIEGSIAESNPIPEPATMLLLSLGWVPLLRQRKRNL